MEVGFEYRRIVDLSGAEEDDEDGGQKKSLYEAPGHHDKAGRIKPDPLNPAAPAIRLICGVLFHSGLTSSARGPVDQADA